MRRLGVVLAALAVTALWGSPAFAQTSEVIHSYDVAIEIRADDSIRVTEVIAVRLRIVTAPRDLPGRADA